jgi:hypothetical protein
MAVVNRGASFNASRSALLSPARSRALNNPAEAGTARLRLILIIAPRKILEQCGNRENNQNSEEQDRNLHA